MYMCVYTHARTHNTHTHTHTHITGAQRPRERITDRRSVNDSVNNMSSSHAVVNCYGVVLVRAHHVFGPLRPVVAALI